MSNRPPPPVEEDDPIVHEYSVFIKPPLPPQRKLLVLQHPNNQSDYPDTLQAPPITDLRLKTSSGMLEADVPLDYNTAYDRHKGIVWGSALQKSAATKTSLGLAGGFGVGGAPARTRGRAAAGDDIEGGDWNEAVRSDRVLRKQTLGGLNTESKDARYLVAVFQGSKSLSSHTTTLVKPG
jgi:DNA-directed RNA polymerase-3 subunit RPC5